MGLIIKSQALRWIKMAPWDTGPGRKAGFSECAHLPLATISRFHPGNSPRWQKGPGQGHRSSSFHMIYYLNQTFPTESSEIRGLPHLVADQVTSQGAEGSSQENLLTCWMCWGEQDFSGRERRGGGTVQALVPEIKAGSYIRKGVKRRWDHPAMGPHPLRSHSPGTSEISHPGRSLGNCDPKSKPGL